MSWYDGVPAALLYAGPNQDYPAAAAASTAAQSLQTGATGGFSQAVIPFGFLPQNGGARAVLGHLAGKVTGQASATTATFTLGLSSTPNAIAGTTLVAPPAITVTSLSNVGWDLDFRLLFRSSGYGTTTVSTSVLSSGVLSLGSTNLQTTAPPNLVTTIDASVAQWLYATVTFSTSSATNSATMQSVLAWGMS